MDITVKSTGMLLDESITNKIKIEVIGEKQEFIHRSLQLSDALFNRNIKLDDIRLSKLVTELSTILRKCWNCQDEVMRYAKLIDELEKETNSYYVETDFPAYFTRCARAAIDAQRYNAQRNKLIRQIDEYLGELDISPTIKSYSEE